MLEQHGRAPKRQSVSQYETAKIAFVLFVCCAAVSSLTTQGMSVQRRGRRLVSIFAAQVPSLVGRVQTMTEANAHPHTIAVSGSLLPVLHANPTFFASCTRAMHVH
jgi:hypothetical protein